MASDLLVDEDRGQQCLRRREDWPVRMAEAIAAAQGRKFAWESHDCCSAVCRVIEAMTGYDPRSVLGGYKTRADAMMLVKDFGGVAEVAATLAARHGCNEIPVAFAQRGDPLLLPAEDDPMTHALGLCIGREAIVAAQVGWRHFPLTAALRAWRLS